MKAPSWFVITDEQLDPNTNAVNLTIQLARFWWARPSFWRHFVMGRLHR